MKKRYKFATGATALLLVAGIWKAPEINRLLIVNSMFEEDKIVYNFSHMNDGFFSVPLNQASQTPSPLPEKLDYIADDKFLSFLEDRNVTSIVASKNGVIHYENYLLDTAKSDKRISWSVAKSFLSALMGIMIEQGKIESIDDKVIKYAPELADSAYKDATIKNVLQMSSGVIFDEDYLDKSSDINKMARTLALGGTMDDFTISKKDSFAAPGETWQYVSIDTHVLGMVIRGASGQDIPTLMRENIIDQLGFESDGYYLTDGVGVSFVLGGLNLTTRDYLRFGLMIENDGVYDGEQIVPAQWIKDSTQASANTAEGELHYGYQWWMASDLREGEFFAHGIYSQYIYIDKTRDVVIAVNSADRKFKEEGRKEEFIAMLRKIAAEL